MLDLHQLHSPPGCDSVTACECEGVLRAHDPQTALQLSQNMLSGGTPVLQSEASETARPALGKQDAQHAFTAKPRLPASLALAYRERGILGFLEQMSQQGCSSGGRGSYIAGCVAASLLVSLRRLQSVSHTILGGQVRHATLERAYSSRTQTSSTGSNVTCIAWHGVSRRLAVGYTDDSVRILSAKNLQPLLKHRTQRCVTQVDWLPNSMSVVCVACDAGVLLWSVDPASVVTRPSGACITLLPTPRSALATVMHPHPRGTNVVCSSGAGVTVWDAALVTGDNIQEGGIVTQLMYSPDATQLLLVMDNKPKIRVFNTHDWSFLEWVCSSSVSCCTWSACSQYVLFCTSAPSVLYSISPQLSTNTATILVDLTPVQLTDVDGDVVSVGGAVRSLSWGGERLLLLFHSCPYIVVFHTSTLNALQLAHGGIIKGGDDCVPITAAFHPAQPSLLTVVWSDNSLQHIPLVYTSRQTSTHSHAHYNPQLNTSLNATTTLNTTLAYAGMANNQSLGVSAHDNHTSFSLLNNSSAIHNLPTLGYNINAPTTSNGTENLSILGSSICSPIRTNYNRDNDNFPKPFVHNLQSPTC